MLRWIVTTAGALVLLAGCTSQNDQPPAAAAPASAPAPPPAPAQPPGQAATADADEAEVAYACEDGRAVQARYGDAEVRLTVGGKTLLLPNVVAASGSKFMRPDGLTPGKSLTWWTKGDEAMLIEAPSGAPPDSPDETIVNCKSAAPE